MADARWVYAPIGGGKSLFCVVEFFKELRRTERFLVTSLPILISELPKLPNGKDDERYQTAQMYCDKWIEKYVDISKRCFFLTLDQQREFWRYLPADSVTPEQIEKYRLEVVVNELEGLGKCYGIKLPNKPHHLYKEVCDFSFRTDGANKAYYRRGCFYQLDECHKSFPARFWQLLGPQVEDYVSELRKLNDDVDFITQHPEKVDKNLRRNATEWCQCVNLARTRLFMGVTLKKHFRYHVYEQSDMPSRSDKPKYSAGYSLGTKEKPEFAYLTLYGQSIRDAGGGVESTRRVGLHPIVWVLAVAGIVALAKFGPPLLEGVIKMGVHGAVSGMTKGFQDGTSNFVPARAVAPQPAAPTDFKPAVVPVVSRRIDFTRASPVPGVQPQAVQCVGVWAPSTNETRVFLSDGRVAYSSRGEVQGIGLRFVKVFNEPPIPMKQD